MTQGLNRQIRRMCEYFGYRVEKLVRTRIMNIELGDLETGKYREVTVEEFKKLQSLIKYSSNETVKPGTGKPEKYSNTEKSGKQDARQRNTNPAKEKRIYKVVRKLEVEK